MQAKPLRSLPVLQVWDMHMLVFCKETVHGSQAQEVPAAGKPDFQRFMEDRQGLKELCEARSFGLQCPNGSLMKVLPLRFHAAWQSQFAHAASCLATVAVDDAGKEEFLQFLSGTNAANCVQ